ncbi:hypothetical protein QQX98_004939 [Neonectria punicea]|uniref:Fungal N-terminal domain-containing protein n=1 Tax=Neonectria punicea TaxID=979145 RepID=A0ABR1H8H6_9HYPO
MAEPASAIIALIAVSVKTCKVLESAISAIKNAPAIVEHWTATVRLLQASLEQLGEILEKRRGSGGSGPSTVETKHHEAIKRQIELFQRDLDRLQRKIPKADLLKTPLRSAIPKFKAKAVLALKNELEKDDSLFARVNQHVLVLQLSVSLLIAQSSSTTENNPGRVVFDINHKLPPKADDNQELREWRQSACALATDAAVKGLLDTRDTAVGRPSISEATSRTLENATDQELLDCFENVQYLANRLYETGPPTMASPYQLKAIDYAKQLRDRELPLFDVNRSFFLEERYIGMLISSHDYDETSLEIASSRLEQLKSTIPQLSEVNRTATLCHQNLKLGELYGRLEQPELAVEYFRTALFNGYLKMDRVEFDTRICETFQLLCQQYQCLGEWERLEAVKRRVRKDFGRIPNFGHEDCFTRALQWCEAKGFEVTEINEQLCFDPLTNAKGNTPLHEAALDPKLDQDIPSRLMLPELYNIRNNDGDTALLTAVENSNEKIVKMLLTVPYLVHVRDEKGQTPLHRCQSRTILELLLSATNRRNSIAPAADSDLVDVNSRDSYRMTALHWACKKGRVDLVETLIAYKADVNAVYIGGQTPLITACFSKAILKPQLEEIVYHLRFQYQEAVRSRDARTDVGRFKVNVGQHINVDERRIDKEYVTGSFESTGPNFRRTTAAIVVRIKQALF